jgi:membrane protease YdiL (CAAX protease family)
MRLAIALLALLGLAAAGNLATPALAVADSGYVLAMAQQPGQSSIDIDVNSADATWWTNPLWIGIGVVALVLLVVIIALAVRGGGTTVIKE